MNDECELNIILAHNIDFYLHREHITRKELADRLRVSVASVGFWLAGKKMPRMDKIDRMCAIFGCSRQDLLSEHSAPPKRETAQDPDDPPNIQDVDRYLSYALRFSRLSASSREQVLRFVEFCLEREGCTKRNP